MYISVAVDAYTDDLLHSAIFPHIGTASAQAFLLALKAKGYRPQVIVTDLNQDYGAAIAAVFPLRQGFKCQVSGQAQQETVREPQLYRASKPCLLGQYLRQISGCQMDRYRSTMTYSKPSGVVKP